jgi:hypothetical protein
MSSLSWLDEGVMGLGGTAFGSGFLLIGGSAGGEATGTLNVSSPVGGVWYDGGAEWLFIRGEGAGCVD